MQSRKNSLVIAAILFGTGPLIIACSAEETIPGKVANGDAGVVTSTGGTTTEPTTATGGTGGTSTVVSTVVVNPTGGTTTAYACDLGESRTCANAQGSGYQICNATRTGYDPCIISVPNPVSTGGNVGTGGSPGVGGTTCTGGSTTTGSTRTYDDGDYLLDPNGNRVSCQYDFCNEGWKVFRASVNGFVCTPKSGTVGCPTGGNVGTGGNPGTGGMAGTGGGNGCTSSIVNLSYPCTCPNGSAGCSQTCQFANGLYQWSTCANMTGTCNATTVNTSQSCTCPNGSVGCSQTCELTSVGYQWSACANMTSTCNATTVNTSQSCTCPNGSAGCSQTCQYLNNGYQWSTCIGFTNSCNSTTVNTSQSCTCPNGTAGCTQTCQYLNNGYQWSTCGGGNASSNVYVSCSLTASDTGTVTVSGDVLGNLFQTGTPSRICLVGDSLGGWDANRTRCYNYNAGGTYTWTGVPFPSNQNRFTFLAETTTGSIRWSNNSMLLVSGNCGWNSTLQLYFYR